MQKANWIVTDSFEYGKLSVIADKAKSLNVFFNEFYLPLNTEMYVYSNYGEMISGPITSKENNPNNSWVSAPFKGDTLNIEIKVPVKAIKDLKLKISVIGYGYKDIYGTYCCGFGTSAACEINVTCPLGNNWVNQRLAVAKVIGDQGTTFFTGEMIMNTCNTNMPYFLTAWHVLDNYVSSWQFIFQYWSPTCNPTQNTANTLQFNGAALIATNMTSDFTLVKLAQTPAANSNITYLGWNRSPNAALNTVGIHQPEGDVMKICSDANPPVLAGYNAPPFNTTVLNWWSAHFQQGTVEPGSSGSALFDQNQRVIGQLTGNPNTHGNYCAEQIGEYGRFDLSWTGGGTNITRLSNWLDPSNSGAMTTNTTSVANLGNASNLTISGPNSFCISGQYSINTTLPVTWAASPTGYVNLMPNGNSVLVTPISTNVNVIVTLTATSNCESDLFASKQIAVGNPLIGTINQGGVLTQMNTTNSVSAGATLVNFQWPNVTGISCYQSSTNPPVSQTGFIYYPSTSQFWFTLSSGQSITVSFSGTGCSGTTIATRSFNVGGHYYVIAPNPASGSINITSSSPGSSSKTENAQASTMIQVSIMDVNGNLKKQQQFSSGTVNMQLNVTDLVPGTYFVQIINGSINETQKLIINR